MAAAAQAHLAVPKQLHLLLFASSAGSMLAEGSLLSPVFPPPAQIKEGLLPGLQQPELSLKNLAALRLGAQSS